MVGSASQRIHKRDSYLDLVRAVALVRVIAFHVLRVGWITLLFPSMGVMFALGGQMMAASLDRQGLHSVSSRFRRVLPSMWLLGLIAVPAMTLFVDEWFPTLQTIATWLLPVTDPVGADSVGIIWQPLWYIRAYLWFVILSPVVYYLFRKLPLGVLAVPVIAIAAVHDPGALYSKGQLGIGALDLLTYGGCWLIGFASHRGYLTQLSKSMVLLIAALLAVVGLHAFISNWSDVLQYGISIAPTGNAAWSAAFAIAILRFRPGARFLQWVPSSRALLRSISNRSMTIYLWHGPAIVAAQLLLNIPLVSPLVTSSNTPDPMIWLLSTTLLMTGVAAIAFGRFENLLRKAPAR